MVLVTLVKATMVGVGIKNIVNMASLTSPTMLYNTYLPCLVIKHLFFQIISQKLDECVRATVDDENHPDYSLNVNLEPLIDTGTEATDTYICRKYYLCSLKTETILKKSKYLM